MSTRPQRAVRLLRTPRGTPRTFAAQMRRGAHNGDLLLVGAMRREHLALVRDGGPTGPVVGTATIAEAGARLSVRGRFDDSPAGGRARTRFAKGGVGFEWQAIVRKRDGRLVTDGWPASIWFGVP